MTHEELLQVKAEIENKLKRLDRLKNCWTKLNNIRVGDIWKDDQDTKYIIIQLLPRSVRLTKLGEYDVRRVDDMAFLEYHDKVQERESSMLIEEGNTLYAFDINELRLIPIGPIVDKRYSI